MLHNTIEANPTQSNIMYILKIKFHKTDYHHLLHEHQHHDAIEILQYLSYQILKTTKDNSN